LGKACWSLKNYLAEDHRRRSSVPEVWGPHSLEEGNRYRAFGIKFSVWHTEEFIIKEEEEELNIMLTRAQ